jgi:hypothetical protein
MLPSFERASMRPVQKGAQNEGIGRSRGELSTKIHIAANAAGHLTGSTVSPGRAPPARHVLRVAGQVHEATQAPTHPRADAHQLIADKGFDTDSFRDELTAGEVHAVIPPMTHRNGLLR